MRASRWNGSFRSLLVGLIGLPHSAVIIEVAELSAELDLSLAASDDQRHRYIQIVESGAQKFEQVVKIRDFHSVERQKHVASLTAQVLTRDRTALHAPHRRSVRITADGPQWPCVGALCEGIFVGLARGKEFDEAVQQAVS